GSSFHQGLAAVIIGGPCRITNGGSCGRAGFKSIHPDSDYDCRYSFVDKNGVPIFGLRFYDAREFLEDLAAVRIGPGWGYVDKSGGISIAPRFELAEPFSEGLAAVRLNGKAGFIDHTGNLVIPAQFNAAESFSDGRALVAELKHSSLTYQFIDQTGNAA